MVTERSHILKKTCSWQLQVCLSMCDFLLPPSIKGLKEKQPEESLASLILRTLAWWERFSIAFRTGSSLKSDKMGRSILRVSTFFSKWSLNFLTTSSSSVIALSPSTRVILLTLRVLSAKFGLIVWQNYRLFSSHWDYCR